MHNNFVSDTVRVDIQCITNDGHLKNTSTIIDMLFFDCKEGLALYNQMCICVCIYACMRVYMHVYMC